MITDVLIARDFSASSERALAYGLDLAKWHDATVHMVGVKVLEDDPFRPSDEPAGVLDRVREQFKERSRATLTSRGFDPESLRIHHALVRDTAPAPALLEYAEEHDVDLVVMGTEGRRGVRRTLMGSVTEEVLRLASCPVFTVRADADTIPDDAVVQRVVAPTDFSSPAREALRYAATLARFYAAPLDVLHVIEETAVPPAYGVNVFARVSSPEVGARVQEALDGLLAAIPFDGVEAEAHVRTGHPVQGILDFATHPGDLIVMSTHGRTGLDRTFMGSVAENVIRRAQCPVLSARRFGPYVASHDAT